MKKILLSATAACAFLIGGAQTVSFTPNNSILPPVSGTSSPQCVADMNNDGLDDVVRVGGGSVHIDYQQANGSFVHEQWAVGAIGGLWSICAADLNGDQQNDLCLGGGNRVQFLVSTGDATGFTSQDPDDYIFSQRSTFQDIDLDGDVDAFVCHDVDLSHPFRNDGTGTMTEDQSLLPTLNVGGNYHNIWCDYDNDGDQDIYISKCRSSAPTGDARRINLLYRNNGDGTFTEVGEATNMNDGDQSWTTVFEDFDHDGDFDAFTVNHAWANRFMQNDGNGNFTDIIGSTGINASDLGAWELDSRDFNNDGHMDIFSEMGKELYLNNGDLTFTGYDLPFDEGGIGDLNNDGFLDVLLGNTIYFNDGNENNWIRIIPQGIVSNYHAIGARVEVHGDFGVRMKEVRSGSSFSHMTTMQLTFGLGDAESIDQVVIKWPSGAETTYDNLEVNTAHVLPELDCISGTIDINDETNVVLCAGETVTLSVDDLGGDIDWNNGSSSPSITVTSAGTYSAIIYDENGCATLTNPVYVSEYQAVSPTLNYDFVGGLCMGETADIAITGNFQNTTWSNAVSGTNSIAVSEPGLIYVDAEDQCGWVRSDSVMVNFFEPEMPVPTAELIGTNECLLESNGSVLLWFDLVGNLIGTGNSIIATVGGGENTFFVQNIEDFGGGVFENAAFLLENSEGGGFPSSGGYNYFDAYEDFRIEEVTVSNPADLGGTAGNRTIQLYQDQTLVEELTVNVPLGESQVVLNFDIEEGTNYSLRLQESNLFRSNQGVDFPIAIANVGSITDSDWGGNSFYYFYNWKVTLPGATCSTPLVPITVFISGIGELDANNAITVYPNPAREQFTIQSEKAFGKPATLQLTNALGQIVWEKGQERLDQNITVDVSQLASGVYQLSVFNTDGRYMTKLIVE